MLLGVMFGFVIVVVLGFLFYWGGICFNFGVFFKWISLFIFFVVVGLVVGVICVFYEVGLWNYF